MRCFYAAVVAGSLGAAIPVAEAAQESYVYTSTHGASCYDRSHESLSQWRCPGPVGYVAEYADEGNIAGIAIWRGAARRALPRAVSWRGAGRVFGERPGMTPFAAPARRAWIASISAAVSVPASSAGLDGMSLAVPGRRPSSR